MTIKSSVSENYIQKLCNELDDLLEDYIDGINYTIDDTMFYVTLQPKGKIDVIEYSIPFKDISNDLEKDSDYIYDFVIDDLDSYDIVIDGE